MNNRNIVFVVAISFFVGSIMASTPIDVDDLDQQLLDMVRNRHQNFDVQQACSLLKQGANPNITLGGWGFSSLVHWAMSHNQEFFQQLLKYPHVDLNSRVHATGLTILERMIAQKEPNIELVTALVHNVRVDLKNGVHPCVTLRQACTFDTKNKSVLQRAVEKNHAGIIDTIARHSDIGVFDIVQATLFAIDGGKKDQADQLTDILKQRFVDTGKIDNAMYDQVINEFANRTTLALRNPSLRKRARS